jgi:hypothetical protein
LLECLPLCLDNLIMLCQYRGFALSSHCSYPQLTHHLSAGIQATAVTLIELLAPSTTSGHMYVIADSYLAAIQTCLVGKLL